MELDGEVISFSRAKKYYIKPFDNKSVISREADGQPVFTQGEYGRGKVYYLNFPLERMLLDGTDSFKDNHYLIYKRLFKRKIENHCITCDIPEIGITYHQYGNNVYAVIINYSDKNHKLDLKVHKDYKVDEVIKGNSDTIDAFSVAILKLKND